ncbi:uncharacterized protein LOC122956241 [Acropora millepora]|uniref:uncharacterized protein LOC122956241 n=1 Tax=Acropora millepora TaxID=45264 RepID=UPI001CF18697|nr:uncharacterized protein LOC122956241 [Acropora millepora]
METSTALKRCESKTLPETSTATEEFQSKPPLRKSARLTRSIETSTALKRCESKTLPETSTATEEFQSKPPLRKSARFTRSIETSTAPKRCEGKTLPGECSSHALIIIDTCGAETSTAPKQFESKPLPETSTAPGNERKPLLGKREKRSPESSVTPSPKRPAREKDLNGSKKSFLIDKMKEGFNLDCFKVKLFG